jgi:hypothetical protein
VSAPRPAYPTRLIEPGTSTPPHDEPGPDGLLDIRALAAAPRPSEPRRIAIVRVGALPGSEFDGVEVADLDTALPGAVLIAYTGTDLPDYRPGLVSAAVFLALAGQVEPETVAVWPTLDSSWVEIVRHSVVCAVRLHARSAR